MPLIETRTLYFTRDITILSYVPLAISFILIAYVVLMGT